MLCMCCKKDVEVLYKVSKEDAEGTNIQGELVCAPCHISTFPSKPLPQAEYIHPPIANEPVKLGAQPLVTVQSPLGVAFEPPPQQAVRVLSIDDALQLLADGNRKTSTGFTWGPDKYNRAWAESIDNNAVIEYSLTIPKDCEQGLGVYLAANIWGSCSYGNSADTSLMMVVCTNTPMLDYSSQKEKSALALQLAILTGVTLDNNQLTVHLSARACRVRAIKKYGNYFALTTGENVIATFDGADIKKMVSAQQVSNVNNSAYPHAKDYLAKLFK